MEGLKCPICEAITLVTPINDGEMFSCPFCKHKFTVTSIRRYFLHALGRSKQEVELKDFKNFLKTLDDPQIFEIIKMTLNEVENRCNYTKEYKRQEKGC